MRRLGRLGEVATIAVILTSSSMGAGEPTSAERDRVATLVREGVAAAKSRQWETCIRAYTAASSLDDSPDISGELGLCEEQAGRFLLAYNHLRRATDATPPNLAPDKAAHWKRYEDAQSRLRKRLVILFITVSPTRAAVILDGRPLGRVEGRHIAVEPGTHTVAARLDGHHDAVEPPRTWQAGDVPRVHLELTPKVAPPPSPLPSAVLPKLEGGSTSPPPVSPAAAAPWYMPAPTPRGVLVPLAAVGLATLAASGATWIGLELDRGSLAGRVGDGAACGPDESSPPELCKSLDERFVQRNIAADITVGALVATGILGGAAGLAVGLDHRPRSPAIVPTASMSGGGIFVLGSW